MLGYCKVPDCRKPVENKDTGLCATHSKALRKIVKPNIKKIGAKMEKSLSAYAERRRVFLQKHPRCAVYPEMPAKEIHHMKGRIGALLLDDRYWLAVSVKAHVEITNNPKWALEKGYSLPRLTKP